MRIAIDARELTGRPTGVGRYLSEILAAWTGFAAAAGHEFVLCAPTAVDPGRAAALPITSAIAPGHGTIWEQVTLPRLLARVRPDVLFAPAYTGPIFSSIPMVLTIHDVSFAAHPEWFSLREGLRRRLVTRLAARRAARVLTVSDFSKNEIVRHLGVNAAKVEVIYSGATSFAAAQADRAGRLMEPGGIPDQAERRSATAERPLILYVGSIFNRRHVPELIDGFARLAQRHPNARLDLVGDNRTHPYVDIDAQIRQSPASARIHARSYVSDDDLARLYREAGAFVFLSEYEGFGFTPLEALAAGIPIVVLDTPVAREIYGPAAVYVSGPDPVPIADALERALFDAQHRAAVLDVAPTVLQRYSWTECAHRTLQAIVTCR